MSFTQTDLDSITEAIIALGSGKRLVSITVAGEKAEYAQADMHVLRTLRNDIYNELAADSGDTNRSCLITTSKGY